jgi:hypothetical protein
MEIKMHHTNATSIAEIVSEELIFKTAQDGLDVLVNVYYQDVDRMIIHEKNVNPDFFVLQTGLAGELLQKFSNYRMKLAIIGDFSKYPGKSIRDFITESNKNGHINFVASLKDAIEKLTIE